MHSDSTINILLPTIDIKSRAIFFLKECGGVLKKAPLAAAQETLPIVAAKLESTAQCETITVPPITGPPKMSKSWLIRESP